MHTSITADEFSKLLNSVLLEGGSEPIPEPLAKFNDDPVALACSSYRHYIINPGDRWREFDRCTVIDEDRAQAQAIRSYYGPKLTLAALTNGKVSQFRAKFGAFLAGNHALTQNEIGLLYKLPYFYAEDSTLDYIIESTTTTNYTNSPALQRMTMVPLAKVFKARRGQEVHQYWFKSNEGYGCVLPVLSNNPLKSIVEGLMYRDQIEVSAYVYSKQHWNNKHHSYYLLGNVTLL